jgi:hypothetical protein
MTFPQRRSEMTITENIRTASMIRNRIVKYVALFGRLLPVFLGIISTHQTPKQTGIDCSSNFCRAADQQTIANHYMFDERNFFPILDGLGRRRKFWVHIPFWYDTLTTNEEKMPVIFAFHGGTTDPEPRDMMLGGKWADYFYQDIAFVIPRAEPGPCDPNAYPPDPNIPPTPTPYRRWIGIGWGPGVPLGDPLPANCDPATQRVNSEGKPVTYNDASLPSSFTDVLFVENLRAMILSRFPKLNANKVYATGFSSGGGMTNSLLCYRSSLFRGFSVVAKTLSGDQGRGDYNGDGITDPNSLVATCGKSQWDPGHATGISTPNLWGYGIIKPGDPPSAPPPISPPRYGRVTKPIVLFVGDQDPVTPLPEFTVTAAEIRTRNNLNPNILGFMDPFMNVRADDAETQWRIYLSNNDPNQPSSAFEGYLVRRVATALKLASAGHAMPDADECPPPMKMTCDYSYTDRTIDFFRMFADLNLNP